MPDIQDLIFHMRRVQSVERDLRDLSLLWQMIEASSAISCPDEAESILPMLTQTRVRFAALQQRLVSQLGQESLAELRDELASTAQCTIDILVRNLYERTADVSFLATDDALREFCSAAPDERDDRRAALLQRLGEYRSKYTVYDDIILTDIDGTILARLDDRDPAQALPASGDPIVAQALSSPGYCEQFAVSDLGPDEHPTLLYGHRVAGTDGRAAGVLVLRFRHADELQQIFSEVVDPRRRVALVLLDADAHVISSNDESHVPVGCSVQATGDEDIALTEFGGREYLSVTRSTKGYQGYTGPSGWRAHAMVSLLTAFRGNHDDVDEAQALSLDNPELSGIQNEVDAINRDLRRVVWNGRLVAGTREGAQSRLKALLTQVNEAGTRTRDRVALAIRDLFRSSLGRVCYQSRELARLAADIMDRNLYERANDCRWWALSPTLQRALSEPPSASGTAALNTVLAHINDLYTVYSRLVVFDTQGQIRGVSRDRPDASLIGTSVEPAMLAAVNALPDSQRYAVTPFTGSALSDGTPTYVYLATIRHPGHGGVAGGIAVVFNSAREFRGILDDVMAGQTGVAAFVDGEGRVIASQDPSLAVGDLLPFEPDTVVRYNGSQYAVARVRGIGYREFRRTDGYDNGVHAVVALRLGGVERRELAHHDIALHALPRQDRSNGSEYALFHVGAGRYAMQARLVLEARPSQGLVSVPRGGPHIRGLLEVPAGRHTRVIPVICARSFFQVSTPARAGDGVVLVVASAEDPERPQLGIMVDHVSTVLDIGLEHLQAAPGGLQMQAPALDGLLRVGARSARGDEGEVLVQLINPGAIAQTALFAPVMGS